MKTEKNIWFSHLETHVWNMIILARTHNYFEESD